LALFSSRGRINVRIGDFSGSAALSLDLLRVGGGGVGKLQLATGLGHQPLESVALGQDFHWY
jgi:hypothetical protein